MTNIDQLECDSFSKELNFMLLLLSEETTEQQPHLVRSALINMDWDHFIELTRHHRVYPIIYKRLKDLAIYNKWIPTKVMASLQREYQRNTYQMLHLSGVMDTVCRILDDNQIRSIFLKGPVLALDLYGDISLRTSCDLDLIVPMEDLARTESLLLKLGYVKDDYFETILGDWKWRHHHITFYHPIIGIKLEIHWRLNPGPSKEPGFNKLWTRKRTSTITNYPIYYLGREDLFMFLVSHGARHGWSRLRWLADIDRLSRQPIDWVVLRELLYKYQYAHIGGQALILSEQLLLTPIAGRIRAIMGDTRTRRLAQDALFYIRQMVNLHTEPVPEHISRYHKRHLFSLMSTQQKIIFILSFLYPYPEDARTLPLPTKLHFLYFPLRLIVWTWRKTKKITLQEGGYK